MDETGRDDLPRGVPPTSAAAPDSLVQAWRSHGARITPERRDLLAVMSEVDGPVTALQVSDLLAQRYGRSVDLSTVYRTLRHLHSSGLAYRVATGGSRGQVSSAYCLHDPDRFSALCTGCDTVVPLPSPVATRSARGVARAADFHLSPGSPAFLGRCGSCAARDRASPS